MAGAIGRELAYRESDGIQVTLLWHEQDDRLAVVVLDASTGTALEVEAGRENALEVFNHPFAYAT